MGIAIVDPRFIKPELAAGQLIVPFERRLPLDAGYWLVWRPGRERSRPLAAFRQWLAEELAAPARRGPIAVNGTREHRERKRGADAG